MAKKIQPPKKPASRPPADAASGENDLAVIHPDRTLTIAGQEVTVREYRFMEGMAVRQQAVDLVEDLRREIQSGEFLLEDVMEVLGKHLDLVLDLVVRSAGVEREWIEGLNHHDGELLMLVWWSVCGPFFMRPIVRRIGQERQAKAARAGQTSSTTSPPAAMETMTTSDAHTPSGS